jgi:hypothetical protein
MLGRSMFILAAAASLLVAGAGQARGRAHDVPAASAAAAGPGYYVNVDGHQVRRPERASSRPAGASAQCRDGSYSFSEHHRGTCSHHGGVATWF